jgi:hypothetical protein
VQFAFLTVIATALNVKSHEIQTETRAFFFKQVIGELEL